MYVRLRGFSSVEELKPIFEHGGEVIFIPIMVNPGSCVYNGDVPWAIFMRSWVPECLGLADQMETLVHEFVHIFHHSSIGYQRDPNETRIFHEKEVERQTKRLMTRHPQLADDIVRALILSPHCSFIFPPESEEELGNPFRKYYFDLVAKLGGEKP